VSAIEAAITRLVQQAPVMETATLDELLAALARVHAPPSARELAAVIGHVVGLVRDGRVDPGLALPHLAMACATLCDPRATEREHAAAQFEIDTLVPVPPKPDVMLADVSRGPRR
jgi:hypothetical protein